MANRGRRSSPATLAPYFPLNLTDDKLLWYLKRKILNGPLNEPSHFAEIDFYKHEPWDLPGFSQVTSRDEDNYFYCTLDSTRNHQRTKLGYWKPFTNDTEEIRRGNRLLGLKKKFLYHGGPVATGIRTNWVMIEYRLVDCNGNVMKDAYVLCKVFHKNNTGPFMKDAGEGAIIKDLNEPRETNPMDV